MSFILDALKKSETDRQRQNGPALFEVRVAPPRDKLPVWAVGLGVLLAVNLVIVAWVLLRRPASTEATAQPAAAASVQQQQSGQGAYGASAGPMGGPQGQQQGWGQGQGLQGQGMQAQGMPQGQQGPGMQPTGPLAQTAGMTAGQQQTPPNGQAYGGAQPQQPGATNMAPVAANAPPRGAAADGGGEKLNPDDYAPAADPAPQPFGNHVTRGTMSGVPLYNDVAETTQLPSLRLDLHVYAANPQERFVMINMHKLHEGDLMTSEGVRVESITPFGAVLSRGATKFLLPRD